MASVDELSAAVAATKDAIEQNTGVVAAAMQQAEELSGQLAAMGVESKSSQAMQVKDSLEQIQAQLAGLQSAAEQIQQQAEALRGLQGDTGGGVSVGDAIGGRQIPTPAGLLAAAGDKNGPPPTEPPTPAAGDFDPSDFSAVNELLGFGGDFDRPTADSPPESIGVATETTLETEPDPDIGTNKFQGFGRAAVRGAEDLSQFATTVEKSANDLDDLFKPPPDPHSYNTGTQVPQPPPVARALDDNQPSGSLDWVGTAVVMSALVVEGASRIVKRRKDD